MGMLCSKVALLQNLHLRVLHLVDQVYHHASEVPRSAAPCVSSNIEAASSQTPALVMRCQ